MVKRRRKVISRQDGNFNSWKIVTKCIPHLWQQGTCNVNKYMINWLLVCDDVKEN
uniref:Uncharacterized protein n=1 Tax=Arion vulgaris TaxID=1028688 RepID=A0A0B6YBK0_9EUPU